MAGRLTVCVFAASCLLVGASARGQVGPPHGGPYHAAPQYATPYHAAPPGWGYPPPVYDAGGAFCPPQAGPHAQAAWWQHDDTWVEPSPFELFLKSVARNSWVRGEWLNWKVRRPGDTLLGSRSALVADPREEFPLFDETGEQFGVGRVLDLDPIRLRDNNGARITLGVPLRIGDVEVSGFMLEQARDRVTDVPVDFVIGRPLAFPEFIGTTMLEGGQLSNLIVLYNDRFTASYTSDIWGTEANLVLDTGPRGEGLRLQPIVGFRHVNVHERLGQVGLFDDGVDLIRSEISSNSRNHLYGPTGGFRFELEHRWFTIGVENKLTLGANSFQNRVRTDNLPFQDQPMVTVDRRTTFSPVYELGLYARTHLTDYFSLHVGYNLFWLGRVTRPHDNIFYNYQTEFGPPDVVVDTTIQQMRFHGLSVGGELRFR